MTIKPCFKIVAIEETDACSEETKQKCGKIFGIYFYDSNHLRYLCESIPSYELYYMESVSQFLLDDKFLQGIENENYRQYVRYFGCGDINALHSVIIWDLEDPQHLSLLEESYEDQLEDAIEECRSNRNIYYYKLLSPAFWNQNHCWYKKYGNSLRIMKNSSRSLFVTEEKQVMPIMLAIARIDQRWQTANWEQRPNCATYREEIDRILAPIFE